MATSCTVQQHQVEVEVLQKVHRWVNEQQQRCEDEPCKWWMLCLNKLVCWFVTVAVKVAEWIMVVVVRWVYRLVCIVVTLVVGVILLVFTFNPDMILQALADLVDLVVDLFLEAIGLVIFVAISVVDFVQTLFKVEVEKRKLTKTEIATLRPIFGDSLLYFAIRVVDGNAGLLSPWGGAPAYTIGFNIYATAPTRETMVHECVHVWQFQFGGAHYIGNSMAYRGMELLGGTSGYDWKSRIGSGSNAWYLLRSVEAQAQFIEDVWAEGVFHHNSGTVDPPPGAFFEGIDAGHNEFSTTNSAGNPEDYTARANDAWDIISTG